MEKKEQSWWSKVGRGPVKSEISGKGILLRKKEQCEGNKGKREKRGGNRKEDKRRGKRKKGGEREKNGGRRKGGKKIVGTLACV